MPNILNKRVLSDLKKCNLYLSGRKNKISDRTLSTKSRKRGRGYEKTVRFQCGIYSTTAVLILIIVLCIGATVKSESRDETQRMENRIQEQQLMSDMKQYLNENGYRNSGVTLTYALEEDGSPDYTFTIHHKKINSMSETERGALSAELARACNAVGNYSVSYEYLLTDF